MYIKDVGMPYIIIPMNSKNIKMKKLLIIFFTLFFSTYSLYSQIRTIKGKVISEFFETMPGVSIIINDTIKIGETDLNGVFKIDLPVYQKKILFKSLGLDPTIVKLIDKCDEVEVVMMLTSTYDFITLKKADKLRMKRFKRLPSLHKQAFRKALFNTNKACYSQEFISYYSNDWN